jgi:hypothetical protein
MARVRRTTYSRPAFIGIERREVHWLHFALFPVVWCGDGGTGRACMRVFLSHHSVDKVAAIALKAAIETRERQVKVFFAPYALSGGGFW